MRWDKSIIRFRVRKHADVYFPTANFKWLTFFSLFENVFYNVGLDILWWIYITDLVMNYSGSLQYIIPMNILLYSIVGFVQMAGTAVFSERHREEGYLWAYVPLMSFYTGTYLRLIRTVAYIHELFFKKSYDDPWNPVKSSSQARVNGF